MSKKTFSKPLICTNIIVTDTLGAWVNMKDVVGDSETARESAFVHEVYDLLSLFSLWCFFVLPACLGREGCLLSVLVSPLERARLTILGGSLERTLKPKALSHWSSWPLTAYLDTRSNRGRQDDMTHRQQGV